MSLVLAALSDSPFLANLGRGERSFWRFLIAVFGGLLAFIVVAIAAMLATVVLYAPLFDWPAPTSLEAVREMARRLIALTDSDGRSFRDAMQIIGLVPSNNVFPIFAFVGVCALAHGRRFRDLVTTAPRFRWRMLVVGLVLSALIIGPFLLVGQLLDPKAQPPPMFTVAQGGLERVVYVLVCFAVFVPAALGEEILFRGWLLRQTSNITRQPLVLMAINGVIFAAAHFEFAPDAFLERALMGAGFAYMTMRLGGVEMSGGVHAANNLMILLFLEPLTLKQPQAGPIDAPTLISYLGLFVSYIAMAELMARWTPLRQWTRAGLPASVEAEHFS